MPEQTKFASFWAQYGRAVLVLCVSTLFLHNIFGAHGFLAMHRTKLEIERVQGDIDRLRKENSQLADEGKFAKTGPPHNGGRRRGELGLAKPNEVIIKIPQ